MSRAALTRRLDALEARVEALESQMKTKGAA
jgi:BMFP domain-containing protein YqiC